MKEEELRLLREKSKETLWLDDLKEFLVELDKVEAKERAGASKRSTKLDDDESVMMIKRMRMTDLNS